VRSLATLGAALAAGGQVLLLYEPALPFLARLTEGQRFHAGWVLLVLGAALFAAATRRLPDAVPPLAAGPPPPPASPTARWLLGLALVVAAANVADLAAQGESARNRWLWAVSLGAFVASASLGFRGAGERQSGGRRAAAWAAPLALTAVAFGLRFVELATLPLAVHGDMARMGLGGRDLLAGVPALFSTGWANIPWLGFAPAAAGLAVFGDGLFGLRMASVVSGTAAVLATYLLASECFGRRAGLFACAAAAVAYPDIHFSRLPAYVDPVPWLAFGAWLLVKGLSDGRRLFFALSGLAVGVCTLLYYSGRISILVIGALLVHLAVFHRPLLAARRHGLGLAALGGALLVAPQGAYFATHLEPFLGRSQGVLVFNPDTMTHLRHKYEAAGAARVLAEQAWRSFLVVHYTPDTSAQFGFSHPWLNPLLGPLFALGLGTCLVRIRSPAHALMAAWWTLVVGVGSALTVDAPFWPRLVVMAPAVAALVGLGVDRLISSAAAGRAAAAWLETAAWGLVALAGAVNWDWYTARARIHVEPAEWLGRRLADAPAAAGFCMVRGPRSFEEDEVRFLAPGRDLVDVPPEGLDAALARCEQERRMWVVYLPEHQHVLDRLEALRPGARRDRFDFPSGWPGPLFVYPPGDAGRSTP
jgi:4-amino-4-deoxy-L-arabinose transferase-like glycosyltransferase